ncbi:glycosyltransferase family 4 protein [Rhodobium gokarnense]|uniref:Glycosyltransferase involved in cell wall biosynthesis n=1 Tax=Rhodobium gokarnense TaxID=364296 RepID=A0ABT3HHT0_9HYPH|nr:glycosyltransferase [Rhodobium gokarnense]MCW2309950.1 glycosyltransferase involved in cell wall biosynthesis [Rhodobium gokarnense]
MQPEARQLRSENTRAGNRAVLFLAQLPPPHHGQSAVAATVKGILERDAGLDVVQKWRGGAASNNDVGKRSLGKYFGFLALLLDLAFMLVSGRRFRLAYLGMAPWAHTAIRDALLAGMARLLADRVWLHVHGDGLEAILTGTGRKAALMRFLLRGTELIAITADTGRLGRRSGLFSHVIDLPNIAADPGARATAPHSPLTVGCLGNLDPRKGVLDFVDAIGRLENSGIPVAATMVGGPTAQLSVEDLKARVAERGLSDSITVTGRVTEDDKSRILGGLDVFLYLSRHDLAPLALIEGLAHGAAPIVLDVGGLAEMVGPRLAGNVLDPALTGTALLDEIETIFAAYKADPALLERDKAAARTQYLKEFSPDRYRNRVLKELSWDPTQPAFPPTPAPSIGEVRP